MERFEDGISGSSETSQAGQSPVEKLQAGMAMTREERLRLPLSSDQVAIQYLTRYGGGQTVYGPGGNHTVICDGHQAFTADETIARWEEEQAHPSPTLPESPLQ